MFLLLGLDLLTCYQRLWLLLQLLIRQSLFRHRHLCWCLLLYSLLEVRMLPYIHHFLDLRICSFHFRLLWLFVLRFLRLLVLLWRLLDLFLLLFGFRLCSYLAILYHLVNMCLPLHLNHQYFLFQIESDLQVPNLKFRYHKV